MLYIVTLSIAHDIGHQTLSCSIQPAQETRHIMSTYGIKAWTIAGYTFNADQYCPACMILAMPTGEGEPFDGWRDATESMTTEDNLDEIAAAFGIDRQDERTFDSDDFPKVIFASQVEDTEYCGACNCDLLDI